MGLKKLLYENEFLRHSGILFLASVVGGFLSYLYQVYVGRVLGPSEYSVFGSIVALLYIISVPTATVQTSIAKLVSEYNNEYGKIKYLLIAALKKLSLLAGLVTIVFILLSEYIAEFLKIDSITPLIILSMLLFFSFLTPVLMGALQGLQMFTQMGIYGILGAFFKLIFGVLLVYLGFGVNGALMALVIAGVLALLLTLIPLRFLKDYKAVQNETKFLNYSMLVLLATLGLTFFPNVDVLLVKHYFSNTDAGYYAAAALLGKIILFATGPIAMVMFPKVSAMHIKKENGIVLLRNSLFYISAISISVITLFFLFPDFIVNMMFGSEFIGLKQILGYFAVALAFFSLANAVVFYDLAIRKYRFLYVFAIISILEISLIIFYHDSLLVVVRILTGLMAMLFFGVLFIQKR